MSIVGVDDDGNLTDEIVEERPFTLWYQPVVRPYNPDGQADWRSDGQLPGRYRHRGHAGNARLGANTSA